MLFRSATTAFIPSILINFANRDCVFTGSFCLLFTFGVTLNLSEVSRRR